MKRLIVTAVGVMLTAVAAAQPPAPGPGPKEAEHLQRLTVLLDLTDSQKAQVQQVLEAEHAKMKAMFEQWKASGQKPTHEQMQTAHEQLRADTLAQVKPILTDSQFTKFQLLMERPHGWGPHAPPSGAAPPASNAPAN